MIRVTLADGSVRSYEVPKTVAEVTQEIGAGLAKAALAAKVNDRLVDLSYQITNDISLAIITKQTAEGLEVLRHSCAHLLAQAVKQLYPSAQVTIGPVIEEGFYYDFAFERAFTPEDIAAIEARMHELTKQQIPVTRRVVSRAEAITYFQNLGEHYKVEIIQSLPENETLSLYTQGDFTDLCRGPHVPHTGKLTAFKLTKHAGAYWRGDANNAMLQRIYGTAFAEKNQLDEYLTRLEEAKRRDHRVIAKTQNLFHFQEEAPGMVFWHPDGFILYRTLEDYIRRQVIARGYHEIRTPMVMDKSLWEASGHWEFYREDMFVTETENRQYAIKPMSCPGHIQVFNNGLKSYRDLPLRFAEFGHCHRCEPSGALHGLLRVRGFVQDDGHIFCTEDQIFAEITHFDNLLREVYRDFGFNEIIVRLSTRPAKRAGDDALWDKTESELARALTDTGFPWEYNPGEGAFYGPKVEYSLKDAIGRVWQVGTFQLDAVLPAKLGASYVAEDNTRKVPIMCHRAVYGTIERFLGILIEHYSGRFPTWLAPKQAVLLSITDQQAPKVAEMTKILEKEGIRAISDLRNEKIGFKIREHTLARVPYMLVVGAREAENGQVSVRTASGQDLGVMPIHEFLVLIQQDIARLGRV